MTDEIKINRTTLLLFIGLIAVMAAGAYFAFGGSSDGSGSKGSNDIKGSKSTGDSGVAAATIGNDGFQEVYLKAFSGGYDKREIIVKKGVPVRFHFTAQNAGCGSYLVIYGLGVNALSKNNQETVVEFKPDTEGTYEYNCGMRMFPPGRFVVNS